MINMQKKIELLPPHMPNFIRYRVELAPSLAGNKEAKETISVSDLTESEAEEYGELMKQEFIKHWKYRKDNKL